MKHLKGRVALVTGASRGIGKGCALELGAAGATVYVTGRTVRPGSDPLPGTIGETAAEIDVLGGTGIAVACDHRDDAQVEALFERVRAERGRLDVLVNNAFIIPPLLTSGRKFWEAPISDYDDMLDVGTRSAYVASWHALRLMLPVQRGLIANVSSSGAVGYAWHVAYGMGKSALDRFTADAAHELRKRGVSVVSLWPGLVRTERVQGQAGLEKLFEDNGGESPRFTGRAVAALAADPDVHRFTGRALAVRELADLYGFRDVDGRLPKGPLMPQVRARVTGQES
jgi:NAD(P)-dependent dehydrogenase (short-subunit alcohol dehydrogenase family)